MDGEHLTADGAVAAPGEDHPLARALDHAPSPFAITGGPTHAVVYANPSFRRLVDAPEGIIGVPIDDVLPEATAKLRPLLDRALEDGVVVPDQLLPRLTQRAGSWSCSIWPILGAGNAPEGLMIELWLADHVERSAALQREVAERLLLSALREAEVADIAEAARGRTAFLLAAGRRLGVSLDEAVTRSTIAGIAMPSLGAWCIVDLIEPDGAVTRLAMVHPDATKQQLLNELAKEWTPQPGDPFGAPAVMRSAQPVVSKIEVAEVGEALAAASHSPENLRLLGELGVGPLLTVPLVGHGKLLGAVTFVSGRPGRSYTRDDVDLAEGLAARSAEALDSARLYGDALSLRRQAEASSQTRMRFMGNISHELRTPLNAISGYAEIMEMGLRGPITEMQRGDLVRIRLNQKHLLVLITDILNFVRAGLTPVTQTVALPVHAAIDAAVAMIENMATAKGIRYLKEEIDHGIVAAADPDRFQQILINLVSNAIKFTAPGGTITTRAEATTNTVRVSVSDTGIGIEADKLETIFEPFVQAGPRSDVLSGVGLGLAISRDLAQAMRGDITVESTPGTGSRFTLTLPRWQS